MQSLRVGEFEIEVADEPGQPLTLRWRGRSIERYPGRALTPFLAEGLDEAARRGTALHMHFEQLDALNSATAVVLIQTIQEARTRGIRLGLTYDARRKTHRPSFEALKVLVKGDDLLRIVPAP